MKRKYFTICKYMGDDLYSWAVFFKGQRKPVCSGCGKSEATYHANSLEKEYNNKIKTAMAGTGGHY